ncbi:hypothetical protein D3C85_1718070 [compost metagenome]
MSWQLDRTADSLNLDMILYSGPHCSIDFTSLRQAAFVFSLAVREDGDRERPRVEATGEDILRVRDSNESGEAFSLRLRPGPAADGTL